MTSSASARRLPIALIVLTGFLLLLGYLVELTHPTTWFQQDPDPCDVGWLCRTPVASLPLEADLYCTGGALLAAGLAAALLLWRLPKGRSGAPGRPPRWWVWLWPALGGALLPVAVYWVPILVLGGSLTAGLAALLLLWLLLCAPLWWLVRGGGRPRTLAVRLWCLLPLGIVALVAGQMVAVWAFRGVDYLLRVGSPTNLALGAVVMALLARALLGGEQFRRQPGVSRD